MVLYLTLFYTNVTSVKVKQKMNIAFISSYIIRALTKMNYIIILYYCDKTLSNIIDQQTSALQRAHFCAVL